MAESFYVFILLKTEYCNFKRYDYGVMMSFVQPSATDATVQQLTSMLPPGALVAVVLNGIMLSPKTCKNALVLVKLT